MGRNYYYYKTKEVLIMVNVEKLSIALTTEVAAIVLQRVESRE